MMQTSPVRARCIPSSPRWLDSFYIGNLIRGLEREGISFCLPADDSGDFVSARWLRQHRGDVDLLHLHWTHYHYTRGNWFDSLIELGKYVAKLGLARRLGYKIVWTMHNYMPHECAYPLLHYVERFVMAHLAQGVVVHCGRGKELLRRRLFQSRNVHLIQLGDAGVLLARSPRSEARAQLGILSDSIVLIFFGSIRPYKGVPDLMRAFRRVRDKRAHLFVVGQPLDRRLEQEVKDLAASDSRMRAVMGYLPDSALAAYLSAADVAVLPYRDVLTSASALTALSFGLPLVAPELGCLPELIMPECGLLYNPASESLQSVLERCLDLNLAAMRLAARARAEQFPWDQMVHQTAEVYRQLVHSEASQHE